MLKNTATITELQNSPLKTVQKGNGSPVAILENGETVFYCVPAKAWEALMEQLEDADLARIAKGRENEPTVAVTLDEI
ncbi:plasmid stabilization protein [Halodesulfovibrio sp.]|uniref:type II toxin-antitoxin system Phd/YefM family antitoxin n=1 Tax=Halodesulfovibrio sp. TaxID=1912772 RepID=UPI0025B9942D|nr:plasmid stabilization protein [Halodesulfovibrio sp.]